MKTYFVVILGLFFSISMLMGDFSQQSSLDFFDNSFFNSDGVVNYPLWEGMRNSEIIRKTLYNPPCGSKAKSRREAARRKQRKNHRFHGAAKPLSLKKRFRRLMAQIEEEVEQSSTIKKRSPSTMDSSKEINSLYDLLDESRCVEIFKELLWKDGKVTCRRCGSEQVKEIDKNYKNFWSRYLCLECANDTEKPSTFTDKTGTIFEHTHLPMKFWFASIELLLSGRSAKDIASSLHVNEKTAERMKKLLITSGYLKRAKELLQGKVEADEAYINSGLKGNPNGIELHRSPRKRGLKRPGRGTFETDKVPVVAIVQRKEQVRLLVLKNVQTQAIRPYFKELLKPGVSIFTDEYCIYNFLSREGFNHQSVNHSEGEYARGEVHCNTAEAIFSLLRQFIRNYRGVSKVYLPLYVATFEFTHNHRHLSRWQQNMAFLSTVIKVDGDKLRKAYRNSSLSQFCQIDDQITHFT